MTFNFMSNYANQQLQTFTLLGRPTGMIEGMCWDNTRILPGFRPIDIFGRVIINSIANYPITNFNPGASPTPNLFSGTQPNFPSSGTNGSNNLFPTYQPIFPMFQQNQPLQSQLGNNNKPDFDMNSLLNVLSQLMKNFVDTLKQNMPGQLPNTKTIIESTEVQKTNTITQITENYSDGSSRTYIDKDNNKKYNQGDKLLNETPSINAEMDAETKHTQETYSATK